MQQKLQRKICLVFDKQRLFTYNSELDQPITENFLGGNASIKKFGNLQTFKLLNQILADLSLKYLLKFNNEVWESSDLIWFSAPPNFDVFGFYI